MDNRAEVREFLISRRAKITPQQAGMPDIGTHRVPGATPRRGRRPGVSVEYYAKLERGELGPRAAFRSSSSSTWPRRWTTGTRASSIPSRRTVTSSRSTTAAWAPPQVRFPTASRPWPTTPTPSSARSGSTRSTPSRSPWADDRPGSRREASRTRPKARPDRDRPEDKPISTKAFQTQLKAIKKWGRGTPDDLSKLTQPTPIANGDNDRMVPSVLSDDLRRRIIGSELIIYPDSGHGGIFQYHERFAPVAVKFLARP